MTKDRRAQAITIVVLAGAFGVAVARKSAGPLPQAISDAAVAVTQPKADPAPQDAIYAMLDAARAGNVREYLGFYAGQMQVSLRQAVQEQGEAGFSKYLRESNALVKGIAIDEPKQLSDREVKANVTFVYQDRNEMQPMYLEKTAAGWKIARLENAERTKVLVPYGTPVQ